MGKDLISRLNKGKKWIRKQQILKENVEMICGVMSCNNYDNTIILS